MVTAIVIPARFAATRLPGKPLRIIAGKTMIQHVYEKAAAVKEADFAIVATDHQGIYDTVKSFGGQVIMTSPNHQTGTDRIAEVAKQIKCDIIVNVQGDEPLIKSETIALCAKPLINNPKEVMATLKHKLFSKEEINNPNFVKVIADKNDYAIYFSRFAIPFTRNECGYQWYKHIGIYAYRKDFLLEYAQMAQTPLEKSESLEQLRAIENGYRIKILETEDIPVGIDTEDDLKKVQSILER
jgi:3-deoxy-manno-octulosonate cytidylyltransferase (CMP-KDO synthetase)